MTLHGRSDDDVKMWRDAYQIHRATAGLLASVALQLQQIGTTNAADTVELAERLFEQATARVRKADDVLSERGLS